MAVNGISGSTITGTLGNASYALNSAQSEGDYNKFLNLVKEVQSNSSTSKSSSGVSMSNVSSSQVNSTGRLNGDYTQGFGGTYTTQGDKHAKPQGAAAGAYYGNKTPEIDRTSALYEQSMELENYLVKTMLSSMRNTIQKSGLYGSDNDYAQNMYEDMLYDNYAEQLTKSAGFGLADQIYLELSGQR